MKARRLYHIDFWCQSDIADVDKQSRVLFPCLLSELTVLFALLCAEGAKPIPTACLVARVGEE